MRMVDGSDCCEDEDIRMNVDVVHAMPPDMFVCMPQRSQSQKSNTTTAQCHKFKSCNMPPTKQLSK